MGLVTSIQEPIFQQSQWSQHNSFRQPIFSHCLSIVGEEKFIADDLHRCWLQQPERWSQMYIAACNTLFWRRATRGQEEKKKMGRFREKTKWRFVWILITKLYVFFWWRHFIVLGKHKTNLYHLVSIDLTNPLRRIWCRFQSFLNWRHSFESAQTSLCSDLKENLDDFKNSEKIEDSTKSNNFFALLYKTCLFICDQKYFRG